jgi:membrane protein
MVRTLKLLFEAYKEWVRDKSTSMAAALAFYELLSLAPLTGFIIFISNKILGSTRTQEDVIPLLKNWFTPQFIKVITIFLTQEKGLHNGELFTLSVLSGLALAYGTKEYFAQIKQTTENVWNSWRDKFGIIEILKRTMEDLKITAIAIGIMIVFVFIRSVLPHPAITAETNYFHEKGFLADILQTIAGFVFIFSLMLFFFAFIPPIKVRWTNAIPGAALTSALFLLGRELMKLHMYKNPDPDNAESFIVVLLWLYYSNLAFVYGAEFNKVYITRKQKINLY